MMEGRQGGEEELSAEEPPSFSGAVLRGRARAPLLPLSEQAPVLSPAEQLLREHGQLHDEAPSPNPPPS